MKIKSILAAALLTFSVSALASPPFRIQFGQGSSATDVTATNPVPSLLYATPYGGGAGMPLSYDSLNGRNSLSTTLGGVNYGSPNSVTGTLFSPLLVLGNTQGTYLQGTIAPAATAATLTPPANDALEGWDISITSNATLAVAGTDTITVALNGVTIYQTSVYIPSTALSAAGQMYTHKEKYNSFIAPKAGASGTFTVTLSTALATGTVNVNEYSGS